MILDSISIEHFRCIDDCEVVLGPHTIIVGPNGAGKSTILSAIEFLCDPGFRSSHGDINVSLDNEPIEVSGSFSNLTESDLAVWAADIGAAGILHLKKTAVFDDESGSFMTSYMTLRKALPAFKELRDLLSGNKNLFKTTYHTFRASDAAYEELPTVTTWAAAAEALDAYERDHIDECVDTPFSLNVKEAQQRFVETFKVITIPAVPDIDEALGGRGGILNDLISEMVMPDVENNEKLVEFRDLVQTKFRELFPLDASTELDAAQQFVNESLDLFAPGAKIAIGWDPESVPQIGTPTFLAEVDEDGVTSDVGSKGHGVQRAIIVAMIHALNKRNAETYASTRSESKVPTTMLLIEEPELYQHPTRSRHLATALRELSSRENGQRLQIALTTHSPSFVRVADFAMLRIMSRAAASADRRSPKRTLRQTTLAAVHAKLVTTYADPDRAPSEGDLSARLDVTVTDRVRECFFADAVVLVEGDSDVAAIHATLLLRGVDADAQGIAILPVDSKSKIDAIYIILTQIGIPTYLIFDGDRETEEQDTNERLLRLLGAPPQMHPPTTITETFAVFDVDRETTTIAEFGAAYAETLAEKCHEIDIKPSKGKKKAQIVRAVYAALGKRGLRSRSIESIADAILAFRRRAN
jgi:predicted ATPase